MYFAHIKNDRSGEQKRDPRHIYSNSIDQVVCPIIYLAIYLSIFQIVCIKNRSLFSGNDQYNRFAKLFRGLLNEHKDTLELEFGVSVEDIGVHSIKKDQQLMLVLDPLVLICKLLQRSGPVDHGCHSGHVHSLRV